MSVFELKAKLSEHLEIVEGGNEMVVTRNGKPIARLVPFVRNRLPLGSFAKEFNGWDAVEIDGANWLSDYPDWEDQFK